MKRALLACLLLGLLSACSFPPYREELSLGFAAAERMADLGAKTVTVGPLQGDNVWRDWFERRDFYYIPNKGNTETEFKSGFVVLVGSFDFQARYVEFIDPDFTLSNGEFRPLAGGSGTSCRYRTETMKPFGGLTLGATFLDAADPLVNRYLRFQYDGSSQVNVVSVDPLATRLQGDWVPSPPTPLAIGSWLMPSQAAAEDRQYFLIRFEGTDTFAEAEYRVNDAGLSPFTAPPPPPLLLSRENLSFNLPADLDNAFYYHHFEQPALIHRASYLCYYSLLERKYKTYSWDDGGLLKPLVKLDSRIDALLSTGELLSFEDNRCTVFSPSGEKKYSFLTGGLRFVYEYFVDGEFYLFFTLHAWFNGWSRDERERLYFYVFALPTRLMKELS